MERHIAVAVARHQPDEGIEMLGVFHLDVRQLAGHAFLLAVQPQVRARSMVHRQQAVAAAMHDHRRLAAQVTVAQRQRLARLQCARRGVAAGQQLAQAIGAIVVEIGPAVRCRHGEQVQVRAVRRVEVVDQLHRRRLRRDAVAGREHRRQRGGSNRRGLQVGQRIGEAVAAQLVGHAGLRVGVGVGHGDRGSGVEGGQRRVQVIGFGLPARFMQRLQRAGALLAGIGAGDQSLFRQSGAARSEEWRHGRVVVER
ncbi:hypothetical protein D3C72_1521600 [compost metagenome]